MSKKKRNWFGSGNYWGKDAADSYYDGLYSNTQRQHQEKIKRAGRLFDEDGIEIIDDSELTTDYLGDYNSGYSSYDYGYGTSFKKKETDFNSTWDSYSKSGQWSSYSTYKPATLSYKYVQQMTNTIANQSGIKVQIGSGWNADIKNKTLTYNPTALMYGTKGELLATLLHEVGKIANSTDSSLINSPFLTKYKPNAHTALSVFEGVRIDMLMLKSYPSASEVYESNTTVIKKIAQEYLKNAQILRLAMKESSQNFVNSSLTAVGNAIAQKFQGVSIDISAPQIDTFSRMAFGLVTEQMFGKRIETRDELVKHLQEYQAKQADEPLLGEYVAEMLRLSYGVDMPPVDIVKSYVDATYSKVAPASKMKSTEEVVKMLDTDVYPIIEKLLQQESQGTETQKEFFGEQTAKAMMNESKMRQENTSGHKTDHQLVDRNGKEEERLGVGRSHEGDMPKDWHKGDYNALRESVDYEIKQLTNRLNFIKREESVERFTSNERRGKLDTRKLYRFATGSNRLFKRKLPKTDTVRSFAFSIMVDISGSMAGSRIVNTVRGLIIFAEVFEKFDIPYEIVCFNNYPKQLKQFNQKLDKGMRDKIGGIVDMVGGGTTLKPTLEKLQIHKQPEANKVVLVLSDGDTESHKDLDNQFFVPWEKKGIKSMGIGIECGDRIKSLCNNNSLAITNSAELPAEFANLLKKFIKR